MARLLIADDNPLSLKFLCDALSTRGYRCTAIEDGDAALALALAMHFDLLLLDLRMPGRGGDEVLAALRAAAGPSRCAPALATTAEDSAALRERLLGAGFADVLPKPIAAAALQAAVARVLADGPGAAWLDDRHAFAIAGGDAKIVYALRKLLRDELEALPAELAAFKSHGDVAALGERLHRLDASAGFCGVPLLTAAAAHLRAALQATAAWPDDAMAQFIASCERAQALLEV